MISSNSAKQAFGRLLKAVQRGPVLIEKHNHPTAVMLSVVEYDRLKLKRSSVTSRQGKKPVNKVIVSKSLPRIPRKPGRTRPKLTSQEMINLVHASELELDA